MIVFLYRNDETEMETETTVTGWLPSLGGWRKDERASRKDVLSALVRLWPVLCCVTLVACVRHEHMFLTSPFFSDHPLCLTTDPTQADSERRSDTCFSSPGTVASSRRTQLSIYTRWFNYRMDALVIELQDAENMRAGFAFVCFQVA